MTDKGFNLATIYLANGGKLMELECDMIINDSGTDRLTQIFKGGKCIAIIPTSVILILTNAENR